MIPIYIDARIIYLPQNIGQKALSPEATCESNGLALKFIRMYTPRLLCLVCVIVLPIMPRACVFITWVKCVSDKFVFC